MILEDKQERIEEWHKEIARIWSKRFGFSYAVGLKLIRSPLKREIFMYAVKGSYV